MRTLEIALVMMNLTALALMVQKSKTADTLPGCIWPVTAGANLFIFAFHCIGEGLRWQMALSYGFVALFAVYALLKIRRGGRSSRTPRVIKRLLAVLAGAGLAATVLLALAFPVFELPRLTGSYPVGVQYLHLVDDQRMDPFLEPSTRQRELMVKIYYPAAADAAKSPAAYFGGSTRLIEEFAAFYQMPAFAFSHLKLVRLHAKADLALAGQQPDYPVILFSHGAGTSMEVQAAQSQDLASHGYVVAAVDHTYVSSAALFPDRLVTHHQATARFDTPEPAEAITQIMADDLKFVIDTLTRMDAGELPSIFAGRLNLRQIGAIGHSVGGAAAYNLANRDPRIKAAVNLDGAVYITPNPNADQIAPVLMLASDTYHVQAIQKREPLLQPLAGMTEIDREITRSIYGSEAVYQQAYETARQNAAGLADVLEASGTLYTIQGSDHMKFTDIGLFIGLRPLRELINIRGAVSPARCLEISSAVSVSFFDQHLKGAADASLDALLIWYPELKRVDLTR